MKLFKFRSLGTHEDLDRNRKILETGQFWCSKFSDLNDPMEGVFTTSSLIAIKEIFEYKLKARICSFSGEEAFSNPLMWGYYANGFKGLAIEIEADDIDIKEMIYTTNLPDIENAIHAKKALWTKLPPWKHECEYRFLNDYSENFCKIGGIKNVYFGDPYGNTVNKSDIWRDNQSLSNYFSFRDRLSKVAKMMNISAHLVKIDGEKVVVKSPDYF